MENISLTRKACCYANLLLLGGAAVFTATLHLYILFLVTTGINRVDISQLTG